MYILSQIIGGAFLFGEFILVIIFIIFAITAILALLGGVFKFLRGVSNAFCSAIDFVFGAEPPDDETRMTMLPPSSNNYKVQYLFKAATELLYNGYGILVLDLNDMTEEECVKWWKCLECIVEQRVEDKYSKATYWNILHSSVSRK